MIQMENLGKDNKNKINLIEQFSQNVKAEEYELNYLRNNYPDNMLGKLQFDFMDEEIKPDFVIHFDDTEKYIFFDLDKLKNDLFLILNKLFENNKLLFREIKDDLIRYSNQFQIDIFKEKEYGFFQNISNNFFNIFQPIKSESDIKNKNNAKKLAFLLSQLQSIINNLKKKNVKFILTLDTDLKNNFSVYTFPILEEIYKSIENVRGSNDNEYISKLKEITEEKINMFSKERNFSEQHIKIFTLYLVYYINNKLLLKEESYYDMPYETLYNMYKLRKFINETIIKYGFKNEANKKFFFDIEYSRFKVIKDTKKEKGIFLYKGKDINDFLLKLIDDYKYNQNLLLLKEDNDSIINFEENILFFKKLIQKQNNSYENRQKEIDELVKKKIKTGIDIGKAALKYSSERKGIFEFFGMLPDESKRKREEILVQNIFLSSYDFAIKSREIDKVKNLKKNDEDKKNIIIKILKEYELKTQIEDIINKDRDKITGIIIKQKINDIEDKLYDKYSVSIIN